jgi:Tol biopolymer transport system component
MEPAVSRASHRLAYSVESPSINNWLFDADDPGGTHVKFAESTRVDGNPNFSADGSKIVFSSDRSGRLAVWSANRNGTNLTRLTEMTIAGAPRWSPDGSEVAFDAPRDGGLEIYAVPAFRGEPRQITTSPENDAVPSYSRDGRWIYFASDRSGEYQIWKVPVEGEGRQPGSARQVTRGGGFGAFESPDGRWLYYAKARLDNLAAPNSLWRVPAEGGTEEPVIDELYSNWCNWGLAGNDVYFLNPSEGGGWAVYKMDLTTRVVTKVAPIRGSPLLHGPGFDVSHDGRWILYSSWDSSESDLMLVENFR